MQETLYVKIEQNIPVKKRELTFQDIASLYCENSNIVKKLNREIFYTLPKDSPQKTVFSIAKVYERIHSFFPSLQIESIGENDFIVDLELPDTKKNGKAGEVAKTILVSLVVFFGASFTIMTFNEDVSVGGVFDHVYSVVMGYGKEGGSVLEFGYAAGLPIGILVFYNHFRRKKIKDDPTPLQVEMQNCKEQSNKALIAEASKEGNTVDAH